MKPNRDHIDWWGRRQQPWPYPVYVHESTPGFPSHVKYAGQVETIDDLSELLEDFESYWLPEVDDDETEAS